MSHPARVDICLALPVIRHNIIIHGKIGRGYYDQHLDTLHTKAGNQQTQLGYVFFLPTKYIFQPPSSYKYSTLERIQRNY